MGEINCSKKLKTSEVNVVDATLTGFVVPNGKTLNYVLEYFNTQINTLSSLSGSFVKQDGTTPLTANWNAGAQEITANKFIGNNGFGFNTGLGGSLISASTTGTAKTWTLPNASGTLALLSDIVTAIAVKDEGTTLTSAPSSLNFVGAGVSATTIGNDVTVTINGGGGGSTNQIFQDVKLGEAIPTGYAVYVFSADGTNIIVKKASNDTEATSSKTLGLLVTGGALNFQTQVITDGLLGGLNTSTATIGNPVWLGTGGQLIYGLGSKPVAPAHLVYIGVVTRVSATNGEILVKVQNGFEIDELHDVSVVGRANNTLLGYNSSTSLHEFKTIATWLGYTPANKAGDTFTGAISATNLSNTNTGDETTATIKTKLGAASTSADGYLTSTDWNTFNGKVGGSGTTNYVPKFTASGTLGDSNIYSSGVYTGIGTTSPVAPLHVRSTAIPSTAETIAKFDVSDDANSYIRILNGTGTDGAFAPYLEGKNAGATTAFGAIGNGTTDTGSIALMNFDSRIGSTTVSTRPLFQWSNFGTAKMLMTASGNLGIGTTSPSTKLEVNGNAKVVGSLNINNAFTLPTTDGTLNQVLQTNGAGAVQWATVTSGSSGITTLNGLSASTQTFATGTTGTDFTISSTGSAHTFNLPTVSATNRGLLSSADWTTFNGKIGGSGTANYLSKFTASGTIGVSTFFDNGSQQGINSGVTTGVQVTGETTLGTGLLFNNRHTGTSNTAAIHGNSVGINTGSDNTGVKGNSSGNANKNIGVSGTAFGASAINVGLYGYVSGATSNYAAQLQDGTEGVGKFLKSITSDGKANWASISASDVSGALTLTSLTASTPLSYNNTTGAFSIQVANTTQNGYLSSTDWNTFNGKVGGSGTANYAARWTGTGTLGTGVIQDDNHRVGINVAPSSDAILTVAVVGFEPYAIRLQDGTQGTGKFLKSVDANGSGNWASITASDVSGVQETIILTTTGTSGAATLVGNTLNIPQYSGSSSFIPFLKPDETYRGISINNNSTTVVSDGGVVMSSSASTLAQSVSSTTFASKQVRLRYYASVVSAGRYTGTRGSALLWFLSGGFRFVCDFIISDTAYSAGCQQFYGMGGVTTDLNYGTSSNILVSTLLNIVGVGSEVGDANLQIFHNSATGTATKIDLGANFPANRTSGSISTTVYSIQLYNEPTSTDVKYEVINKETGDIAQGTVSTNLPLTTQGLNFFASRCMSVTSVTNTGQFDLIKLGVYSI